MTSLSILIVATVNIAEKQIVKRVEQCLLYLYRENSRFRFTNIIDVATNTGDFTEVIESLAARWSRVSFFEIQ